MYLLTFNKCYKYFNVNYRLRIMGFFFTLDKNFKYYLVKKNNNFITQIY